MEFSATFCFFKDWTKTLNEMKFDSDGWLWFNEISSQKKFFYKAIFKRINVNNSTLKNQCYRITAFSKNDCYSFIHRRFWSFTTAESVMLFTNDGDTIKGMRRVKQAGRFACLTLKNIFLLQDLLLILKTIHSLSSLIHTTFGILKWIIKHFEKL